MSKVEKRIIGVHDTECAYVFRCPGCNIDHLIFISHESYDGPTWSFNGDCNSPRFRPSLLIRWSDQDGNHVCHSFITDGNIEYLPDSTHKLSSKTVPLPDLNSLS